MSDNMESINTAVENQSIIKAPAAAEDFTLLENGMNVTRIVQIWPMRAGGADVRMWMGEIRVDGSRLTAPCYVKLKASCKAKWRALWRCRNAHTTVQPGEIRYIQVEFPEPALDCLSLRLLIDELEVHLSLERMPGTETFLWRDTNELREFLLKRAAANSTKNNEQSNESYLETAYSHTEYSPSGVSGRSRRALRSGWTPNRTNWSEDGGSLRVAERLPSVILDREAGSLVQLSPALERTLKNLLSGVSGSKRGALFAMVHSIVVDCLKREGVDKAGDIWKEIERSYGTTPFIDNVLQRLEQQTDADTAEKEVEIIELPESSQEDQQPR